MLKKLSIIIPVYNEQKTIKELLYKVINIKLPIEKEIIIIDDGSKDNSSKIIQQIIKDNKTQDIKYYYKNNGGKGSAIKYGLKKANGDLFIIQDADLEYDPQDYLKLLKPILEGKYKVVYGTRYHAKTGNLLKYNHFTYKLHKFGNQILSLTTSLLYGYYITDMETCYKMLTREVYSKLNLKSNDFKIEPEITAKILKLNYKIKEVPINYYSRDFNEGKKITWKDGIKALMCLIKYRFIN